MTILTSLPEWRALLAHQKTVASCSMLLAFKNDPTRFTRFSLEQGDIFLDYSKNRITPETLPLLFNLAEATLLRKKMDDLFAGRAVNFTEKRPALHTALRNPHANPVMIQGVNIMTDIHAALQKMREFTEQIRQHAWRGATGKPIRDIVNIGIGGSHLGPMMATHALRAFHLDSLRCHFISNIDSAHLQEVLQEIDPEATLFIISSKSFTTLETMTNANTLRAWLQEKLPGKNLTPHFVAVTAAFDKAREWGIPTSQIFPLWEWVGGRFSVWSAIGLPVALMIGMDAFLEFLQGAHKMDVHFQETDFSQNMPVIMALLGIWYIHFFAAKTHAVIPYTHQLNYFRAHLQQLDMESNGKSMNHHGEPVDYLTGPIIWGEQGCTGQHAFHQLLHQGQHVVPIDFILVGESTEEFNHQDILIASGLSQAEALLRGKTTAEAYEELRKNNYSEKDARQLAPHQSIPGNRSSNILFLKKVTPFNLGALLALYEHKIFVQGALWDINSFDQWGVELGKQLLPPILQDLTNGKINTEHDASTQGLIQHYKNLREQKKTHEK